MRILGIETSCDETAAAIIEASPGDSPVTLLSNVVASSLPLHAKTDGIIPEAAARAQIKYIIPVIQQALNEAGIRHSGPSAVSSGQSNCLSRIDSGVGRLKQPPQNDCPDIDAIAVTIGPGLIGSLLVGVETAKTLAYIWNKPIIPINHLIGHIYANFIEHNVSLRDHEVAKQSNPKEIATSPSAPRNDKEIEFPALALIVSGGHTDLVLLKAHGKIKWLGGTRDDAAGEAFDKIGRLLSLPYPGGPEIEKAAKNGNPKAFNFPRPLIGSDDFDFSFSGLKTAVLREVKAMKQLNNETIADLSAAAQQAIIDVLVKKTLKAAQQYKVKSILLSGGVAANQKLKEAFISQLSTLNFQLHVPPAHLCTDNAAMIASAAFFNYKEIPWQKLTANPELYFD